MECETQFKTPQKKKKKKEVEPFEKKLIWRFFLEIEKPQIYPKK